MMIKSYQKLRTIKTFKERFEYLKLQGTVGSSTFGYDRYLNQHLYNSPRWKKVRDLVIIRDNGCDLGIDGYEINDRILVHPITVDDIENDNDSIYDLNNLISSSKNTHDAIHFGNTNSLSKKYVARTKHDTCPWRD